MTRLAFRERLARPQPILADGAMGTLLIARGGISSRMCLDEMSLHQPERVKQIHRDYIDAGSEMIETNTYGANRYRLAEYGLADQVEAINRAAVLQAQAAVQESGRDVYIAGAVGPLGESLRPYGNITEEQARDAFAEQIRVLIDAGVDVLLLETFSNHVELLLAIDVVRSLSDDIPIIANATFSPDSLTSTGYSPARVASDLMKAGVDLIGVNCSTGPAHISQVLHAMHKAVPEAKLAAMPNAGYPESVGGRIMYTADADYFGDYAPTFQSIGARIIGGCCGTTPAHIAAMRAALDDPARQIADIHVIDHDHDEPDDVTLPPTDLAQRMSDGHFTVTVEMAPPRSYAADRLLSHARLLRQAGADAIDVADTPAARMKMSAWAVSHLIQDQVGMETVLHFPTRGRNILRVQGDLLAAHALGLRNLFVTMGDPTRIGDYPEAMDSYDIVPSKLIDLIKHGMNGGHDMAGNSIGRPTAFTVGCALNMAADNLERELKVLGNKLAAGADFALGQPVFDPPRIDAFLEAYQRMYDEPFRLPVIMGVMPLYSLKHASFLHHEVPGITIPDHIFKRMEAAGDDAPAEGVRIAVELMRSMQDRVQGAYIIPSFERYHLAAEVVDAIVNVPAGI